MPCKSLFSKFIFRAESKTANLRFLFYLTFMPLYCIFIFIIFRRKMFTNGSYNVNRNPGLDHYDSIVIKVRFLAFVFSLISFSVLVNSRLKNALYKYLAIIAFVDALYVSLMWFVVVALILMCGSNWTERTNCSPSTYYVFLVLFVFISEY
jgi:hypothetical protein